MTGASTTFPPGHTRVTVSETGHTTVDLNLIMPATLLAAAGRGARHDAANRTARSCVSLLRSRVYIDTMSS